MGRLQGKRVLVTGAARGIGRAVAARCAAEGAALALVDVDEKGVRAVAAEAAARRPLAPPAIPFVADVADEEALARAFAQAIDSLGGLDVVIANAAVQLAGEDARAEALGLETWRRTLDVNLGGAFLTAKHGLAALRRGGGGAVVFTTSPAGLYGIAPDLTAYSASKAGMVGLVRALAVAHAGEGIRVNGVLPGITLTPMNHWWTDDAEQRAEIERSIPLGRPAEAAEIAAVIAFLASDDASYVTGALWAVDGGLTAA